MHLKKLSELSKAKKISKWIFTLFFHPRGEKTSNPNHFVKRVFASWDFVAQIKAQIKTALCCIGEKLYLQMTYVMEQLSTLQI